MLNIEIWEKMEFLVYVSDIDTHDLIYINPFGRAMLGIKDASACYGKCYSILQGQVAPCSFCTNEIIKENGTHTFRRTNEQTNRHYFIKDLAVVHEGRNLRIECAIDISEVETDIMQTRAFLETERSLVACVQQLTSCTDLEGTISQLLGTILNYYGGARGYIFEFDWEGQFARNTFERCAEGVSEEMCNLQNVPLDTVDVWINTFKDKQYMHIKDVNALKYEPERYEEYTTLHQQGIKSLLAVPFYCDEVLWGFLGVDDPQLHGDDVQFLLNLTYFISNELEKRRMHERLSGLSYCDQLTKVCNRNSFFAYVDKVKNQVLDAVGVVFVDLNGLKVINDTYGHLHGDNAIRATANFILKYFLPEQVYRISGDEFVIVMEETDYSMFRLKVDELTQVLMVPGEEIAAIGYLWDRKVSDIKQMVMRAEEIMYVNKQKFYATAQPEHTKHRPPIVDSILREIEVESLCVHLQPKAHLDNEEVYGAEALVRRMDADGKLIFPYEFINLLEREKLIAKVDFFVLNQVCKCMQRWELEGRRKLVVSVNISRITLSEIDFVENVRWICDYYQVPYTQIELEITESAETMDDHHLREILLELSQCGFKVALDDMGMMYSSFGMLTMTGFSVVKLDRSLINTLETDTNAQILIRHIINLCHELGHECVAEGVETIAQREMLCEMACDSMQGYLLDKPLEISLFEKKYM